MLAIGSFSGSPPVMSTAEVDVSWYGFGKEGARQYLKTIPSAAATNVVLKMISPLPILPAPAVENKEMVKPIMARAGAMVLLPIDPFSFSR